MNPKLSYLLLLVFILSSCQREQDWDGAPDINAKVEPEQKTRTSISVDESGAGTIYWNPSDRIDVFFGTKKAQYTSQNASDAIAATFKTSDSVSSSDVSSTNIWGLYPSNSSSSCNGSSITTTLPSTQYGVPNTFDKDLFPAVAHSSSTNLQFYNVCGGIKFNLAYDDIKKITFRGNNNENLAGTVSISFVDNLPKATVVNGVKEITLSPKTGTTFTKGADYYFILLPVTLSAGFTMTFTATDGTTGTLNYTDNPVTIKRSIFGKKGNMDVYAAFADERQPNNVIYYTSADGQVVTPYKTDVFGANIVSNEYVSGRGIITFDGDITRIGNNAFSTCIGLTSIVIPNSVTSIRDYAFSECSGLTSIVIPNSVTGIGNCAFSHCSGLTSIVIPNSVTEIGNSAFSHCSGLTSIVIPNSVSGIGSAPLASCSGLISIIVEDGNPSYDSRNDCNAIIHSSKNELVSGCMNTIIPDSVNSIGYSAFVGCSGLTSIGIPNSVTSIGTQAFSGCSGLTSIEIPSSVTSIGHSAFRSCSSLATIEISSSITSIEPYTFASCNSLTSVTVPNSVTSIGYYAFAGCSGLTSITISSSVASIGHYAFDDCSGLTSVSIPISVTTIGNYAFGGCSGLTSITEYAKTPPTLGSNPFIQTNSCPIYVPAQSVDTYKTADGWSEYADRIQAIPSHNNVIYYTSSDGQVVTPYKAGVFGANIISNEYKNGEGVITFEADVTAIGREAFRNCSRLTSIRIPDTVTYIGYSAFYSCSSLASVRIPDSVTSIGQYAFRYCRSLVSVDLPDSVITIEDRAFETCEGLTSIEIPNSVTSIGEGAFSYCSALTSIEIPSSVTSIGINPFGACSGLASIVVESGNPSYDSRNNCNAIISTTTNYLITGCKNTVIPDTVTRINGWAFLECSGLTAIEIPSSVSMIIHEAFLHCIGLTSITVFASTPPTLNDDTVFDDTNDCPIYVPAQSVDAYKSAWSVYADRIQAIVVHEAVDLGLSVKWATCNVGADTPEGYGDYFAWGETETKSTYEWSTYQWCNGTYYSLTKYNFKKTLGIVDNKMELDLSDDVAHVRWGGNWRMPTDTEIRELWNNCEWTWIVQNGVVGYLVTSNSNGNSIFLPAAGDHAETNVYNQGTQGAYWASSLYSSDPNYACYLKFYINTVYCSYYTRIYGLSIRPVKP